MSKLQDWQVAAIDGYLANCMIDMPGVPNVISGAEIENLVKTVRAKAPWGDLLTDWDVRRIVFWLVSRQLRFRPDYVGLLKGSLESDTLVEEAKSNLVQFLESLPRPYHVYFPLSRIPSLGQAELVLSDTISLVDTGIDHGDLRLVQSPNELLAYAKNGGQPPKLSQDTRYVRIRDSGYADGSLASQVIASTVAQLKHFIFVAIVSGTLVEAPHWSSAHTSAPQKAVVARHSSLDEDEQFLVKLPDEFYGFLQRLALNSDAVRYLDTSQGPGLLGATLREPQTPQELASAIQLRLQEWVDFLSIPRDDPDAVRIKAATEWWMDAAGNQNQTIEFLQLCIGFEALLGDSSSDGKKGGERSITERLADRFAYLSGRTQSEREERRKQFSSVYERRGRIVHQREIHLRRNDDAEACFEARWMLSDAIVAELRGLMKARAASAS
jgi:hypothetical protein